MKENELFSGIADTIEILSHVFSFVNFLHIFFLIPKEKIKKKKESEKKKTQRGCIYINLI